MIDTIRFKIPMTKDLRASVVAKSVSTTKRDEQTGHLMYQFFTSNKPIGSWSRKINLFFNEWEDDFLFIELSFPKYQMGNNVFLLYPQSLESVTSRLNKDLLEYFGNFPVYQTWEIQRLDLCYAWKFENREIASYVLRILRSYSMPKQQKYYYSDSLMSKGSTYSVKFYLKEPEFYKHDFPALMHENKVYYAYQMLGIAEGVLRFEVTMRKKALKSYFKYDSLYIQNLNHDNISEVLKGFFVKFLGNDSLKTMTTDQVFDTLKKFYNKEKALHLWQFYRLYHSDDPNDQLILKENYDRSSIWRMKKNLTVAGIGLPTKNLSDEFEFSIPSKFVVNPDVSEHAPACGADFQETPELSGI